MKTHLVLFYLVLCPFILSQGQNEAYLGNYKASAIAVNQLKEKDDFEGLLLFAQTSKIDPLRLIAINQLHKSTRNRAQPLLDLLRQEQIAPLEGGTEQQYDKREVKQALIDVIATQLVISSVSADYDLNVSVFIESAQKALGQINEVSSTRNASNEILPTEKARSPELKNVTSAQQVIAPAASKKPDVPAPPTSEVSSPNYWLIGGAAAVLALTALMIKRRG